MCVVVYVGVGGGSKADERGSKANFISKNSRIQFKILDIWI